MDLMVSNGEVSRKDESACYPGVSVAASRVTDEYSGGNWRCAQLLSSESKPLSVT